MPQVFPVIAAFLAANAPAITAGAALAGAGASIGSTIANDVSGPQTPNVSQPPAIPTGQPPRISPSTVQASNDATAADLQARGGGGLSPLFTQLLEGSQGGGGGTPYTTAG